MNVIKKSLVAAVSAPLLAAACALFPAAASAESHSWKVINDGSTTIVGIYTAEAGTNAPWESTNNGSLHPGYNMNITERGGVCDWDVKIVWADGHSSVFDDVDTCDNNLRLWY